MTRESVHVVRIPDAAGLCAAQEISRLLQSALADHDNVVVATDAVTGADVTTVQLLLAARKQSLASGKSLTLAAPPVGVMRRLLVEVGCLDADGMSLTPDGDFWTTQVKPGVGRAI